MRLLAVLLTGAASVASAQSTYYVDPGGDDADPGSAANPWATLQRAASGVGPGDTVIVRAGSYAGMHLTTSGMSNAPITFHGESGAVVDADNPTTPDGLNLEGASFVIVEGFEARTVTRAGIRAVLCEFVTIRNNVLDQNGRWGVLTGFCDDVTIEGNQASRSGIEHGIYVSNSGDRPTIRNNLVFDNNANGIHMNGDVSLGGDGIISGALVERNIIYGNGAAGGSGINCDGVRDSVFQNNLIYDTHASGVSFYQIDGGAPSTGNLLVNNTVVVASNGRWALNIQDGSTGNRAFNNILVNLHSFRGSIDISADSLPGFSSDNNVVLDRLTTDGASTVLTLAEWTAGTGQDASSIAVPQNAIAALFAGFPTDYHLAMNSVALDTGRAMDAPPIDLDGIARPRGLGVDIGAYELCPPATCTMLPDAGIADAEAPDGAAPDSAEADADVSEDADVGGDAAAPDADDAGSAEDATPRDARPDAGTVGPKDASIDSGADPGIDPDDGDGCGCHGIPARAGEMPWGAWLSAALLLVRSRRRR